VIDVSSNTLVGMNRCVSETVQVQVTGDEIFILRSDRRFHRLSYKADQGMFILVLVFIDLIFFPVWVF